jgi:hypothetical protein
MNMPHKMNRRGEFDWNLGSIIGAVVVLLVILSVLGGTYDSLETQGSALNDSIIAVANESFTLLNSTNGGAYLVHNPIVANSIYVINASNNVVVGDGNYTLTILSGYIRLATTTPQVYMNGTAMKASYSYTTEGMPLVKAAFQPGGYGFVALGAVILASIVLFFVNKGKR